MSKALSVAVVGATGLVGQTFIQLLEKRNFPVSEFHPFASLRSRGKTVRFRGQDWAVRTEEEIGNHRYDIAFFSAGGNTALRLAGRFVAAGALVIDNSSAFRMEEKVPLIIPEVNRERIREHQGIIANPNCSTIQLLMALSPLRQLAPLRRVTVTTMQSVSGTGQKAVAELESQIKAWAAGDVAPAPTVYPHPIFGNCLPQIDRFLDDGSTFEEQKMLQETNKILEMELPLSVTCVRVPVFYCHAESVNVEFSGPITAEAVRECLAASPGVKVVDEPAEFNYPLQAVNHGGELVEVGRIRRDPGVPHGIAFFCVTDNVMKGAALNGIQVAEQALREEIIG